MDNSSSPLHRFQDQNLTLHNFYSHILVKCPHCQKRADITTDLATYTTKFICPNCLHQYTSLNKKTDLILNVYCLTCAHRIYIKQPDIKQKSQAISITCQACKASHIYQPEYKEYTGVSWTNEGHDPFLGLELWLQIQFKNHLLWAFNYAHLTYLENYIAAKLRQRNNRKHMTMVEKLPLFMKSAKNREALLKTIGILRNKPGG